MRRRLLFKDIEISPQDAECCDVVFCKPDGSLVIRRNSREWKKDEDPIGIVVIPASHGVLKDGTGTVNQCGVISIVKMNYAIPEKGGSSGLSTYNNVYWGWEYLDISDKSDGLGRYDSVSNGLLNYQHVVTRSDTTSNIADGYSSDSYAYIPRQYAIGSSASFYDDNAANAPSPYIGSDYKSGGYNESYGLKDGVVGTETNNVLSDFKGIVNTKIITDQVTVSNWKTATSISNSHSEGKYPAACCCARYKTAGTKAFVDCSTEELRNGTGFWYLPAAGELGYVLPRLYDINDTIMKLRNAYGVGENLITGISIWSSSEYSNNDAYSVSMSSGFMGAQSKDYNSDHARAFLRL